VTVYPPLLPGAVMHLKLDEGSGTFASDSTGNGNNGTVGGGAVWTTQGVSNGALTFDGINDVITVPSTWKLDSPKGTWSAWVKTDGQWGVDGGSGGTTVRGHCVVLSRHNATASREGCHIIISADGVVEFQYKSATQGQQATINSSISVIDNNWHHIAATYDQSMGGEIKLYVDGVLQGTGTSEWPWWFNNQPLLVADSPDVWWEEFAGTIDDVQIYNVILSATDISLLYNSAGKTKKPGDINSSGTVDEVDLAIMASQWLGAPGTPSADMCPPSGDGVVDMLDLAVLANDWLD
jgi:hypothetical protein